MDGQHHLHLRKWLHERLEPFPHPDALKRGLDKIMVFIALAGPLAMLPQVYQVFATKDAKGLSLITWLIWTMLSVLWVLYGYLHKEAPILVSNIIYIVFRIAIIVAIILYS